MSVKCIRIILIIASIVPFAFVLNGCNGGGITQIDEQTEIDIGRQGAADIEKQYGLYTDAAQNARVQRIGMAIASKSPRPQLPWSYKILNSNDVNAVSLPGGFVYVMKGLLDTGLPDSELEGVIGHETAHIVLKHSVKAIERAADQQLLASLVLGRSSQDVQTVARIAVQLALELPHSRQDEYASDATGIRLAYNGGFPANGLTLFLERLQKLTGPNRTPSWLSTHPVTADRITRAKTITTQVEGKPRPVPVAFTETDNKIMKALEMQEKDNLRKTPVNEKKPVPVDPSPAYARNGVR